MTLSVRSRFEVFKRDAFTCGYCGRTPSDEGVKLEVDHITPRADGGGDEITNLVTSCWDCNSGKSSKGLKDKAPSLTVAMANTRERTLQLEEYRRWQGSLDSVNNDILIRIWDEWIDAFGGTKQDMGDGKVQYCAEWVKFPNDKAVLSQLETLELSEVIEAVRKAGVKYRTFDLARTDALRYFFGILKHMREDKRAESTKDTCDGACGYDAGKKAGVWFENERLKALFLNRHDQGFYSYADVVASLWPEAD